MIETRFLRNKKLIPLNKLTDITIIGLGGIGSFVSQYLTIMGFKNITGYDNDIMKDHNLSSTAYPTSYIGKNKAIACQDFVNKFGEDWQSFKAIDKKWTSRDSLSLYNIVCTDDMESRKSCYKAFLKDNTAKVLIDARMGATTIELVTVTKNHDDYMKHWIPTDSIDPAPCSMKHSLFATTTIASLTVSQLYNIIVGGQYYDYIWSSLSPISFEYGQSILPNQTKESSNASTSNQNPDGLGNNPLWSDVFLHRSAENGQDNSL